MRKLQETLQDISNRKSSDRPGLMTHVVLGYPSLDESIEIVKAMSKAGVDLIELQIPFSDPMADGPTIMRANEEALREGVTPAQCMQAMGELSSKIETPLLFMSYFNIVFSYRSNSGGKSGIKCFLEEAQEAGAQGLIVPDVPPEENREGYWTLSKKHNLIPVPLVSPLTSKKRLQTIASNAEGFVYCVSTTGTTGTRTKIPDTLPEYLKRVRRAFKLPLAVGFGISTAEQVNAVGEHAEIAIVGSAMIEQIRGHSSPEQRITAAGNFTEQLVRA